MRARTAPSYSPATRPAVKLPKLSILPMLSSELLQITTMPGSRTSFSSHPTTLKWTVLPDPTTASDGDISAVDRVPVTTTSTVRSTNSSYVKRWRSADEDRTILGKWV